MKNKRAVFTLVLNVPDVIFVCQKKKEKQNYV